MKYVWVVSCYAHEQPRPETWHSLAEAVDASGAETPAGMYPPPAFRQMVLEDDRASDRVLRRLRSIDGAVVHVDRSTRLEEADFDRADLVGVFAEARDAEVTSNANQVLTATGPCPLCGLEDAFDVRQDGPFVMTDPAPGADALNLPGGGMAVSEPLVTALSRAGVRGFAWEDVIGGGFGARSRRWSQLVATTTVLVPCPEHTAVHGEPFCPACGRAHGRVDGYFWVPSDAVEGTDLISRHPAGRTMFYLSRRAFEAIRQFEDIRATDVLMICRH